jgi:hypothetical protein
MDIVALLLDALLAMFHGPDKGHWRPDTSIFPSNDQTRALGAQADDSPARALPRRVIRREARGRPDPITES